MIPNECLFNEMTVPLRSYFPFLYKNPIPVRYSELLRHLPSISKKMLTEQLRELERDDMCPRANECLIALIMKLHYDLTLELTPMLF